MQKTVRPWNATRQLFSGLGVGVYKMWPRISMQFSCMKRLQQTLHILTGLSQDWVKKLIMCLFNPFLVGKTQKKINKRARKSQDKPGKQFVYASSSYDCNPHIQESPHPRARNPKKSQKGLPGPPRQECQKSVQNIPRTLIL